ncbi:MAG: DMT family transporter [Acidobacteriota bacterium]
MVSPALAGTAACLLAAGAWAVAVLWFRGAIADYGPWTVNLAKCGLATVLLAITVLVVGQGSVLLQAPLVALGWIAVSGLVGMTLGDTALFAAVPHLGVHRTLLLQTLNPLFTALGALLLLGEDLAGTTLAGGATVLAGVALVIARDSATQVPGSLLRGGLLALLAAFGQGLGVVLAKLGMVSLPFLSAALVRLATATAGLVIVLACAGAVARHLRPLGKGATWRRVAAPSVLGTYLAILLMMAGIAWSPAAVAAVLLSTSPIFSLFLEARIDRTALTPRALAGTLLAVAGVAIISWPAT